MKEFGLTWLAMLVLTACAREDIPTFGELDSDGNGRIKPSEAERSPALMQVFGDVDADQDGQLTVGEYLVAVEKS